MNDITLLNGETFSLIVDFLQLLEFKSTSKDEYEKFNKIVLNGPKDIFDMLRLVYGCYLMNSSSKMLNYNGFMNAFPTELRSINDLTLMANQVINGKKSQQVERLLQP